MSAKTKKLEEDNAQLRARFDLMNKSLVEVAQERNKGKKSLEAANSGKRQLENLCRVS